MAGAIPTGATITPDMFIAIGPEQAIYLILLGFLGGMLSGFIGSGGAFVLTPGMMAIGAPGAVAVASNMCHKFPKAMIGAWRRAKVGHLDVKLAVLMAISAIAGVQVGIKVQTIIAHALGPAGTSLYVSVAFLVILPIVAALCLKDVVKARRHGLEDTEPELASKLEKKFRIPPMIHFKTARRTQSLWLTIPTGFATGFLAATIAVGGFIGVPSMIYIIGAPGFVASGTELGIAFVMGSTGTFTWAYMLGAVDFRMTALILFGSLFGVQIGAVGTTYVRQYMIKLAMGVVMLLITLSRGLAIPKYLYQLGWIQLNEAWIPVLDQLVFWIMVIAMTSVTPLVLGPMFKLRRDLAAAGLLEKAIGVNPTRREGTGRLVIKTIIFGIIAIGSYILLFTNAAAWTEFATMKTLVSALGIIGIAIFFSTVHGNFAHGVLDIVNIRPISNRDVIDELSAKPERLAESVIATPDKKKAMKILVATDGSEYAKKGADYAASLATPESELVLLHVIAHDPRIPQDAICFSDCEERDKRFLLELHDAGKKMLEEEANRLRNTGLDVETRIKLGNPSEEILRVAKEINADMIVIGARGVSKWKKILLGSVSEEVLDKTDIPVFIVR